MYAYDPYNGISYRELNKHRRDESNRVDPDKTYDHSPPATKKIYVKRFNDPESSAKFFIWKKWESPDLKNLIKAAGTYLGMDRNAATRLYDSRGIEITDEEQIFDGMIYIVAGDEKLDFRFSRTLHRLLKDANTNVRLQRNNSVENGRSESAEQHRQRSAYDMLKVHSGDSTVPNSRRTEAFEKSNQTRSLSTVTERRDKENNLRAAATTNIATTMRSAFEKRFRRRDNDAEIALTTTRQNYDNYWDPPPRPFESVRQNYAYMDGYADLDSDPLETIRRSKKNPPTVLTVPDDLRERDRCSEMNTDDLERKDRAMLETHKKKIASMRRSSSAVIYNRKDQTHPDTYIIYVFLNGHGMESQYVHFQRLQLQKGMNFVLEIIARRFGIKPGKLCNMDGKRVRNVDELMSRGAYVLVPVGQSFWDAWYFLPDNAIDTSSDPQKAEQRRAQRERLIQLRERHQTEIRANLKTNATHTPWNRTKYRATNRYRDTRSEADQHYFPKREDEAQRTEPKQNVRPGQYFLNVHPRQ